MAAAAAQVPVGAFFGLPGYTQPFEQYENLNNIVTTLSLSAQTPWNPPGSLQKTDIVKWWEMETIVSWTTTVSGGTPAMSPEAPYNIMQSLKLKLQGQYTPLEVESGFDAAFFQLYRPMRGPGQSSIQNLIGANPAGNGEAYGQWYSNPTIPQANQTSVSTSAVSGGTTGGTIGPAPTAPEAWLPAG